ncbi:MAG: hypothetical protein FK734_20165 [Asgard group archaeon]|nr:hypothetical protein [Asgard group archaeon]
MKYKKSIYVLGLVVLASSLIFFNGVTQSKIADNEEQNSIIIQGIDQPNTIINSQVIYGFKIKILHAYYYDLDNDRFYDDVYTIISISSLSGYAEQIDADIYQYITTPSGRTYYFRVHVYGYDSYFRLYTKWYNVATEKGWYKFKATIENINYYGYTYDTASVIFDPPTSAPEGAMPTATVSIN